MLLDQSLHLEKRRQQIPFILGRVNRIGQGLIVIERLEKRIERIPMLVWIGNVRLLCLVILPLLLLVGGRRWLRCIGGRFRLRGTLSSRIGSLGLSVARSLDHSIIPC